MKRLLHPLSYIMLFVFYSSLAVALRNPATLLLVFLLAWLSEFRQGARLLVLRLAKLQKIGWLIFSLVIIQLIFRREGEVILSAGFVKIYSEALSSSAFLSLRIMIIYLCAISLSSLDFSLYRSAFSAIHLPEEISFMVSYMIHLIPEYTSRFKDQLQELKERGIRIRKLGLAQKISLYKILSLSAIANIILQSGKQAIALELRGFRSRGKRSNLYIHKFTLRDLAIYLWMLAVLMLSICLTSSWYKSCILFAML